MYQHSLKKQIMKGFTLVELLIVVIILAILAAIVVPQFSSSTDDAKESALDSTLSSIRSAIDIYYQQHGHYPGSTKATVGTACGGTAGTGAATGGIGLTAEDAMLSQLTYYTAADGTSCSVSDGVYKYGPYLKKRPLSAEPFTVPEKSTIEVVAAGDLTMGATGGDPGGYKYDSKSGRFIVNIAAHENR